MTAPISNEPTTTRLHHYAGRYSALYRRFSPNGSTLWRPHHLKPRPHRHQPGEITPSKPPTRRRHADDTPQEGFAWRKTPIAASLKYATLHPRPAQCPLARKYSPSTAPRTALPRKTRPASTKTPNLGCCERAGRTISRFRDDTAQQGELFRAQMKPPPPLLAPSRVRMKPATPLLAHNAAKTHISGEQR